MKPASRFPLHLIVIFLVFAAGIAASGYFSYETQKRHFKEARENELSTIATLKVNEIVRWRAERLGDANAIAQSPIIASHVRQWFQKPGDSALKAEIIQWMGAVRGSYHYQSIILADANANLRLSVPDDVIGPSGTELIKEAIRTKKVLFGDLHKSQLPGKPRRLNLIAPLLIPKGGDAVCVGAVLLRIDPYQFLYPFMQSWPTPSRTSETVLVRREGDQVVYLNELRHQQDTALTLYLPMSRSQLPAVMAVQGRQGIVEAVDYRGVPVVAALMAIPDTTWFISAEVDADEIYAPLRERALIVMVLTSMLVVLCGLAIGLIWRRQEGARLRKAHDELEAMVLERTAELEQARRQNELILNSAGEGIFMLNPHGKVIFINPAALKMLGYEAHEVVGRSSHEAFHHTKRDETPYPVEECPVHQTLSDGDVHSGSGEIFWRKDGTHFPIDYMTTPVRNGVLSGSVIIFKDATERVMAEEERTRLNEELKVRVAQLEAANKELADFSYNVSHDLKAPLRAIAGFSGIFMDEYGASLDDEARRLLGVIGNNARKMGQLVDGLTEYLRIGRREMVHEVIDMRSLVEGVWEEMKPLAARRVVRLNIKDLPPCLGDREMVRQVLVNLISNAVKFTRPNEEAVIEVGSCREEGEYCYYVRDNGVGFDMRYENKLFQVFQHLHGMEEFEGAGIGLAMVKRIIEKHGGRVWAKGKVGEGAVFYFTLHLENLGA